MKDYDAFRIRKGDKDDKSYRKNVASHNYNERRKMPGSPENKSAHKALEAKKGGKMFTSPTGSKHRMGSAKHKYWQDITSRGKTDHKYGAGD